eukprot:8095191-Ditylum_brightwellii.AAC.1
MQEEVDLVVMEQGNLLVGIPIDIIGAVVTVLTKSTTVLHVTEKRKGTKMQQQGPTPWNKEHVFRCSMCNDTICHQKSF